jgi:hypothetical protein
MTHSQGYYYILHNVYIKIIMYNIKYFIFFYQVHYLIHLLIELQNVIFLIYCIKNLLSSNNFIYTK